MKIKNIVFSVSLVSVCIIGMAHLSRAAQPSDFNLKEGDVISATGDLDVYIVNSYGYKRLFVNPQIFNLYGHLGWDKIKKVSPEARDAFITSGLFRNCETDDQKVYGLDVVNEDTANLRWVNTSGTQAVKDDPNFFKEVFCINTKETRLYGSGQSFSSVSEIPNYSRITIINNITINKYYNSPLPTPSATISPTPTPTSIQTPTPTPIPNLSPTPTPSSTPVPTPTPIPTPIIPGTLTVSLSPDTQISRPIYWGQNDASFSKFKLVSVNEGFYVERLNFNGSPLSNKNGGPNTLTLTYNNKAGQTITANEAFNMGRVTFAWDSSDSNRPYVPKDGSLNLTLTASFKPASQLFRAAGISFSVDFSGGNADQFRAVGENSGTIIDGSANGISDISGNSQYIYRSYPVFSYLSTPATTIAVGQDVFKFKIDAIGLGSDGATVFFDGATSVSSGSLKFEIYASGSAENTLGFDLRRVVDSSGSSVDQLVATQLISNTSPNSSNALEMRFQNIPAGQAIEIPGGSSNTFVLRLNAVTGFSRPFNSTAGLPADYIQLLLKNDANGLINWVDKGGVDRNNSNASVPNILKNLPMTGSRIDYK